MAAVIPPEQLRVFGSPNDPPETYVPLVVTLGITHHRRETAIPSHTVRRLAMPTTADIPVLTASLLTTEAQIDRALDTRNQKAFKLWCQRRTCIAKKLQGALLVLASY